jgi:hypothetical protein
VGKDARGGSEIAKGLKVLAAREEQGPPIVVIGTDLTLIGPKLECKKDAPMRLFYRFIYELLFTTLS